MFMGITALKDSKSMHICTEIYNLWCLVYNNTKNAKLYVLVKYLTDPVLPGQFYKHLCH